MRHPIFVRPLTDLEREQLVVGLRSSDALVLRRCQILLAFTHSKIARVIAKNLGCGDQTVRNAITAFNARGLACLEVPSARPHTIHAAFTAEQAERLKTVLPLSPRTFGKPTRRWT